MAADMRARRAVTCATGVRGSDSAAEKRQRALRVSADAGVGGERDMQRRVVGRVSPAAYETRAERTRATAEAGAKGARDAGIAGAAKAEEKVRCYDCRG